MVPKTKGRRSLRYANTQEMPEGMRRLVEASTAVAPQPTAARAYRPPAAAQPSASGNAAGKVARGRPRHVPGEMNKTEEAYAAHLKLQLAAGAIAWFRFESVKLKLAEKTHLTIDFFVMTAAGDLEAHEVKGFWEEDARVKVKVAAAMYPFRFLAVQRAPGGGWKTEVFS
ncbi:hypothetical protein BCL79_1863 [Stenotrophomonas rhizophila]|uniref:DUF1064 domain-containing protein n=1 Tax=Stenotrophomonas rhizophila TaxID=216778 RepID=A0A498CI34_9GAMM|nr:hypothetical protein [Stenotrophomonas rhizophila]RLK57457.1 hypothetical protein BCL79_1863 [Stenotrophomonas rhizophila]